VRTVLKIAVLIPNPAAYTRIIALAKPGVLRTYLNRYEEHKLKSKLNLNKVGRVAPNSGLNSLSKRLS
jgi:hypothetical protein